MTNHHHHHNSIEPLFFSARRICADVAAEALHSADDPEAVADHGVGDEGSEFAEQAAWARVVLGEDGFARAVRAELARLRKQQGGVR